MIKKIKTIADELAKNGGAFSRADLAYELKMADSVEVEKLVRDAYVKYHNDKNIADAFISNDGGMSVVDFAAEMAKSLNISNLEDDLYVEHGSLEAYSTQ